MHNTKKKRSRSPERRGRGTAFSGELMELAAAMAASGRLIPLKDDVTFKMFLSDPSPESNACLRYLLSALTGREVTSAKVTNSEILPEYAEGKMPRMDVNCKFNDGQKADIELQLTKADDDQKLRSLFYACKLYAGTLRSGAKYRSVPNVYQIFLIDFDLFGDGKFYHRAMMRLDDGKVLTDRLQMLFFNLKVPGEVSADLKRAANWCKFIAGSDKPEVVKELGGKSYWKEEYMTALEACIKISAEERAWAYHLSTDRAEADYRNGLELAEEKGLAKGLAKGRDEARAEAARNMLARGFPVDDIADITGLPLEAVGKLAAGTEPVLS